MREVLTADDQGGTAANEAAQTPGRKIETLVRKVTGMTSSTLAIRRRKPDVKHRHYFLTRTPRVTLYQVMLLDTNVKRRTSAASYART